MLLALDMTGEMMVLSDEDFSLNYSQDLLGALTVIGEGVAPECYK